LKVRWDIDSDGYWDSDYAIEKRFSYKFKEEGQHTITLEVLDSYGGISRFTKTVTVMPLVIDSSLVDQRDHQVYKTVGVYGKWYMAENLRYGKVLEPNDIASDNGVVDVYQYTLDSSKTEQYGNFYTWNEATDYHRDIVQGVCPNGWRIMNYDDFQLLSSLLAKIFNKNSFIGIEGLLHLDFPLTGRYFHPLNQWDHQSEVGYLWLSKQLPFSWFSSWMIYREDIFYRDDYYSVAWENSWREEWREFTYQKMALPIRCVKE
jgi:uncharacterized protein (TIGR02145 family)